MVRDKVNVKSIAEQSGFRVITLPSFGDCVLYPNNNPPHLTPYISNVIKNTLLLAEKYGIEYVVRECGIDLHD